MHRLLQRVRSILNFRLYLPLLTLLPLGCQRVQPPAVAPTLPEVLVSVPLARDVIDYETFTGRTESSRRVELRPRVTGLLEKASFSEGDLVKENDLLFVVDPKPYQAALAKAEADRTAARFRLQRLEKEWQRGEALLTRQAITREEYDKLVSDRDEARANVSRAEAEVELAALKLSWTQIRAPFTGRISRLAVDPGNLVKADETILTTLVAVEPTYAYFDVDERTLLRQLLRESVLPATRKEKVTVQIGLVDEEGFPHRGTVNFVDNKLDPNTGTLWMRAVFENPSRPIHPGMFVRVRFPVTNPYPALLVAEQAIGTDQGQKFLYVVDTANKVQYRPVTIGKLHGSLRVIRQGLQGGEQVVVSGIQRVRPNSEVRPKRQPMPIRGVIPDTIFAAGSKSNGEVTPR